MIPANQLREALGTVPAGVTVVATRDQAGGLHGFTASSFVSVSLEPPLVLICLKRASSTYDAFAQASSYSINFLQGEQRSLATQFAAKGDRFKGVAIEFEPGGTPVLSASLVSMVCTPYSRQQAGDHLLLVGLVQDLRTAPGDPLIHCSREFWNLRLPSGNDAPVTAASAVA
jgi:flavin reductase (DIM6/NTAB) family NADH-FMN oxidoreductase RutF